RLQQIMIMRSLDTVVEVGAGICEKALNKIILIQHQYPGLKNWLSQEKALHLTKLSNHKIAVFG
ncbi:hypothetical protein, partial [Legionella sainthelensi]